MSAWPYDVGIMGAVGVAATGVEMGGVYRLQRTDKVWTVNLQIDGKAIVTVQLMTVF